VLCDEPFVLQILSRDSAAGNYELNSAHILQKTDRCPSIQIN